MVEVVAVALEEQQIRHLEMLQGVITRMATNSTNLKTWTITLLAGIFALSAKDADRRFLAIAIAPAIGFWTLDAYFLALERRYRRLYDAVRTQDPAHPVEPFTMSTAPYATATPYANALLSPSLLAFYGAITAFVLALVAIIY